MTAYLTSAAVLAAALVPLAVAFELVARKHRRSILARFTDEPGAELVPVALPPVSTLPVPDPDGWSAQVGWSAWTAWLDARHAATFPAEPVLFAALAERYLTEPQRELPAAPKPRTRRKTTVGSES